VQTTLLFNAAGSYEWSFGSSVIPAMLLLFMGCALTVSLVRDMEPKRRATWLNNANGSLAVAITAKVFFHAAIFTALGTLGIIWLRMRGWPVNGSVSVLVAAQFLLFLANGFAMTVTVGLMRGLLLPSLSLVSICTGASMAFGNVFFPLNQSSWFVKLVSAFLPYTDYMQVQAQHMQMGAPPADSLGFLCRLGLFALMCGIAGYVLIRVVMKIKAKSEGRANRPGEPVSCCGSAGGFALPHKTAFLSGPRMVCHAIKSEPGIFLTLLAATIIYSFYYPAAYATQTSTHLPVAIVDLDNSAQSRSLIRKVTQMRAVEVTERPASLADARRLLERREIDGIMLIAEHFGRDALTGRTGRIALHGNNAFLVRSMVLLGALGEATQDMALEIMEPQLLKAGVAARTVAAAAMPVQLVTRPLYNTREGYGSFIVSAIMQLIVHQALFIGILMVLGRRRQLAAESGMPLEPLSGRMFAGVLATFFALFLANSLWINGFALWFQDYPRGGNTGGMLFFTLAYAWPVVAGSLFVGGFVDRVERGLQFFVCSSAPFFFVTGVPWPVEAMPAPLRWISQAIPVTPGVAGYAKLNQMSATLAEVRGELLHLMILGAIFTALAWLRLGARSQPQPRASHIAQTAEPARYS
jgi:ABC-2 type transport system permease protein